MIKMYVKVFRRLKRSELKALHVRHLPTNWMRLRNVKELERLSKILVELISFQHDLVSFSLRDAGLTLTDVTHVLDALSRSFGSDPAPSRFRQHCIQ